MRVAGPRPWVAAPIPRRWLGIAALTGAVVVAASLPGSLPPARDSEARLTTTAAALSMADALGLGGLPELRLDDGALDASLLAGNQVVAYYGTPRQPSMGILGEFDGEALAWMVAERAARFDALNGDTGVLPALHIVYAVAQPQPGDGGLHLRYVDDRTVRSYLSLARRHGFVLILDLQIGHSNAVDETLKVLPYLAEPDVHLALDPEFALAGGDAPGQAIGTLNADDINAVQWTLSELARSRQLPRKMLIVHQFEASMIADAASIEPYRDVDLVIDMDGYGPAHVKEAKYGHYAAAPYAPFPGIKLFLKHDPDLMTERQVLEIEPRPAFIVYQ